MLTACRPQPGSGSTPASALTPGPDGQPLASRTHVPWHVAATGALVVDVPVRLSLRGDFSLVYQRDTERLAIELEDETWWLDDTGACVQASHPNTMLFTEGGRLGLASAGANVAVESAQSLEGGLLFAFMWHGDMHPHGIPSQRIVATYRREASGYVLTGGVGMSSHNLARAVTQDGVVFSWREPTPSFALGGTPAVLRRGTWHLHADGSIRRVSSKHLWTLAVDGERIWGLERLGRRRSHRTRHALVGIDHEGREFFRRTVNELGFPSAYRDLVCILEVETHPYHWNFEPRGDVLACFDLDGRAVAPELRPVQHLTVTTDGWSVVQSSEDLRVYDDRDRLAWSQPIVATASKAVVNARGHVCVISRPSGGTRLQCWGESPR
jgi:hypothetical protein